MAKRVLSVMLVLCMVLSMLPTTAMAATGEITASGYCGGEGDGTNLTWTLYEDGELIISGSGAMESWTEDDDIPWAPVCGNIKTVTIGDGVTTIGYRAFAGCEELTSVDIGNGVTIIGDDAFYNCGSLTAVTIGGDVAAIGNYAFADCSGLERVEFLGDMPALGEAVFGEEHDLNCYFYYHENTAGWPDAGVLLTRPLLLITSGPRKIVASGENWTFYSDGELVVNGTGTVYCDWEKYCEGIIKATVMDGVIEIGEHTFVWHPNLTCVSIANSVTRIGESAFEFCGALTDVMIGAGLEYIDELAFGHNPSLERVVFLGDAVETNEYAFESTFGDVVVYCYEGTSGWPSSGSWNGFQLVVLPNDHIITVGPTENGTIVVNKTACTIGQPIIITATPDAGYGLKTIYVDGVAVEGNTFTVTGNHTVTATFAEVEPERGITASGYCGGEGDGTNLTWTLYEDGELVISGKGKMVDTSNYPDTPWYELRSSIKSITIEDGVTTIGDNAFHICWSLTQLNIANSVTSIGECAFHNCYSLKSVEIPEGVTTIGEGAFEMCFGLTTVSLPDSLMTIEDIAFMSCDKLESVHIPAGVTSIGRAFDGCTGLMEITVDDANTAYSSKGGVLFNKAQTVLVCCPGKKNGHYTIPDGVTTIREHAFSNCTKLTSVTIPNGVATIGDYAFWCVGLNQITIPTSVTTIGFSAFYCSSLTRMEFLGNAPSAVDANAVRCDNLTIYYHEGTTGWTDSEYYDAASGTWCGRPLAMLPAEEEDNRTVIASGTFENDWGDELSWILNATGELVISCSGSVAMPDFSQSSEQPWAEYADQIVKVKVDDGLTRIGSFAFSDFPELMELAISFTVYELNSSMVRNSPKLTTITVDEDNDTLYAVDGVLFSYSYGEVRFDSLICYPANRDGEHYTVPECVDSIFWDAFRGAEKLTSVTIPDSVDTIDPQAFYGCRNLVSVNIPDKVTAIEDLVFYDCRSLTNIDIPDGVTYIGKWAFYYSGLTSVDIPEGVTHIGEFAFYGSNNLTEVRIPAQVEEIGFASFTKCAALTTIDVVEGNSDYCDLEGVLFTKDMTKLIQFPAGNKISAYTIPDGVTTIETRAIMGCNNLSSVKVPSSVTVVGEYAFSDCKGMKQLIFEGDAPEFYEFHEADDSRFDICYFTGKNGWTNGEHYDPVGTWYGHPVVELFTRRGLAAWLVENAIDPNIQVDTSESFFTDVAPDDENFREIMICSHLGLFAGSDGKFNPDGTISRAQLATLLCKVVYGSEINADALKGEGNHFTDTAAFEGGWAEGYINLCTKLGLMKGYDDGTFRPGAPAAKKDIVLSALKPVITVGDVHNGTVTVDKTTGIVGDTVTVTAVPDAGYQLRKILVSGKAIDGNTFTITGNHFVTALFGIIASITTDSVDDATQHVPYSAMIQTDHWDDSMSFELAAGKLPAGLELKKSGELYGVPSQAGTFTFTVNAVYSDDGTVVDSKAFSLTVLEDIPKNIEDVNKGPEGYEVKEHIGTPVTNEQGETHYEIDVQKVKAEDLIFVSEGEFDEFVDVYLDGRKLIRDEEYTVEEGSTKITIRAQTFKNAGNGQHVIAAEFRAGETLKKTAQSVTVSGVKTASIGGGSVSTVKQYKITVEPNANGTITCTRTSAREKEVVVVKVNPAAGYIVKSVSVGSGVNVSANSGNEYKFAMPASDVTISVVFEAELPFGDVAAEGTFYEAVKFVYENGIMVGTGENNFAPDAKLSRAMVVQVLYNYEKQPEVTVSTDFTDVPEGQWYTSAVRWATEKGVVAGYGDGTFGTDDDVTIEQVAVILWNYAGQPVAEGETVPTESSQWAVNALDWCAKQGVLEGVDADDTAVAATRAQTALILMNFLQKVQW